MSGFWIFCVFGEKKIEKVDFENTSGKNWFGVKKDVFLGVRETVVCSGIWLCDFCVFDEKHTKKVDFGNTSGKCRFLMENDVFLGVRNLWSAAVSGFGCSLRAAQPVVVAAARSAARVVVVITGLRWLQRGALLRWWW